MAEESLSPISAAKPPAVNPLGAATSAHASTLKLKPVIRKPTIGGAKPGLKLPLPGAAGSPAAGAAAPSASPAAGAMDQLKSVTQKLKGVTQQIPQQAILQKTGIIADQSLTDAQKQASKSRTARISLSDALGVAPVKSEAAPMKTIRIKRPVDIPGATPAPTAAAAPAPAVAPQADESTITQRKTLKIARPAGGAVKPAGKFGLKKPGAPAKAEEAPEGEVADIPELPPVDAAPAAPVAAAAPSADEVAGVPGGLLIFDFILQFAACLVVGFLGYLLYVDLETAWF